jgi:hypothetical protein
MPDAGVTPGPGEIAIDTSSDLPAADQIAPVRYRRRSASGNFSIAYLSIVRRMRA